MVSSSACPRPSRPLVLRAMCLATSTTPRSARPDKSSSTKAWGDQLDPTKLSGIRFLADPTGAFTKALDLGFDVIPVFGNTRSKRYAIVVEDGKVKSVHVEPDNTGTDVSMADKVLG
ncbi:hypothetical protein NPX13_g7924 [Xylaria arbuscula]|uniref:Redoxin domain-containing protein n=1 Tax=Xylaria arbuscula TaxID=114810 RepID=A0A9W8TKB5_9PEZI|nr:hypothetical protein NPX13_g7924 [Xylaria arbuscula]